MKEGCIKTRSAPASFALVNCKMDYSNITNRIGIIIHKSVAFHI